MRPHQSCKAEGSQSQVRFSYLLAKEEQHTAVPEAQGVPLGGPR